MGAAYQFRDDLLGMFGDPSMTGKSDRDDLRDGKPTLLVCTALELLEKGDRSRLLDLYTSGRDDDATVQEVRALLRKSGAMKKVEDTIATVARDTEQAIAAAPLPPAGRQALTGITASFLWRQK